MVFSSISTVRTLLLCVDEEFLLVSLGRGELSVILILRLRSPLVATFAELLSFVILIDGALERPYLIATYGRSLRNEV